ncbi:MAG: hypothetical protein ABIT37_16520, partial [Luteolibacter sp.]
MTWLISFWIGFSVKYRWDRRDPNVLGFSSYNVCVHPGMEAQIQLAQSRKEWEPALTAWIFRAPLFTRQRHWARKVAHKVLSREWG